MSPGSREVFRLGLLFLIVLAAFSYFNRDSDLRDHAVESRMALVKALVDEQRFEIDSYHDSLFYTADKASFGGHYYSDKAIGASLLGAIAYKGVLWLAARTGWVLKFKYFRDVVTILAVSFPSALIAPLLYLLVRRVAPSASAGQASFTALAVALGTPYFKYSTAFFGHTLAALFLPAAFYIWFEYRRFGVISGPRILLSGFLLGWAVITEYPTLLLAGAVGFYILFVLLEKRRLTGWKSYALLAAGAMIPLSILLIYNWLCFGGPFNLSYRYEVTPKFNVAHNTGLFGVGWPNLAALFYMTVHPSMGIFWQSPILVLAIPGWFHLFRAPGLRAEAWFTVLVSSFYLLFSSGYYLWWGDAFTPRHIIPVLPLFVLPLAALPRRYLPWLGMAGAVSMAQMLIVAAGNSNGLRQLLIPAFETGQLSSPPSIIYSIYFQNVLHGIYVHNLGSTFFGLQGGEQFLPLAAFEAIMVILLVLVSRGSENTRMASTPEPVRAP